MDESPVTIKRRTYWILVIIGGCFVLYIVFGVLLPGMIGALCNARQAAALGLVKQLDMAVKKYEEDHAVYPPGDGTGSRGLVSALSRQDSNGLKYFTFTEDMLIDGHILNPAWPDSGAPQNIIYYRNNIDPASSGGGGGAQPPVFYKASVDIWCAGCSYTTERLSSSWGVNNFE